MMIVVVVVMIVMMIVMMIGERQTDDWAQWIGGSMK